MHIHRYIHTHTLIFHLQLTLSKVNAALVVTAHTYTHKQTHINFILSISITLVFVITALSNGSTKLDTFIESENVG